MAWNDVRTPGQVLTASQWNAVIDELTIRGSSTYGCIIFQDETKTYAYDNTGNLLSSVDIVSESDDIPIQAAHDYLTTGGLIYITPGTYTLSDPISITNYNINIRATTLTNYGWFISPTTITGTEIDLIDLDASGFSIRGFLLKGGTNAIHVTVTGYAKIGLNIQYNTFFDQTGISILINTDAFGFCGPLDIKNNVFRHTLTESVPTFYQTSYIELGYTSYITALSINNNVFEPGATIHISFPSGEVLELFEISNNYSEENSSSSRSFIHFIVNSATVNLKFINGIHGNTYTSLGGTASYFIKFELVLGQLTAPLLVHHNYTDGITSFVNTADESDAEFLDISIKDNRLLSVIITGDTTSYFASASIIGNKILGNVTLTRTQNANVSDNRLGDSTTVSISGYKNVIATRNYPGGVGYTYTITLAGFVVGGSKIYIKDNVGYVTENVGRTSIADGGTIDHGLVATPTWALVTPITSGEFASVTDMDGTHLTIAIKKHDNSAGTTQFINWMCGVY